MNILCRLPYELQKYIFEYNREHKERLIWHKNHKSWSLRISKNDPRYFLLDTIYKKILKSSTSTKFLEVITLYNPLPIKNIIKEKDRNTSEIFYIVDFFNIYKWIYNSDNDRISIYKSIYSNYKNIESYIQLNDNQKIKYSHSIEYCNFRENTRSFEIRYYYQIYYEKD